MELLICCLFKISYQVCPFSLLLDSSEDHFCSRDVLLGILQILHQGILSPGDAFVLVGICVRESSSLTRLPPKQTMEIWSSLMLASLFTVWNTSKLKSSCLSQHHPFLIHSQVNTINTTTLRWTFCCLYNSILKVIRSEYIQQKMYHISPLKSIQKKNSKKLKKT